MVKVAESKNAEPSDSPNHDHANKSEASSTTTAASLSFDDKQQIHEIFNYSLKRILKAGICVEFKMKELVMRCVYKQYVM